MYKLQAEDYPKHGERNQHGYNSTFHKLFIYKELSPLVAARVYAFNYRNVTMQNVYIYAAGSQYEALLFRLVDTYILDKVHFWELPVLHAVVTHVKPDNFPKMT